MTDLDPEDPYIDASDQERYVLYITITISTLSDTGALVWFRKSPPAILERYWGEKDDIRAPDWCRSFSVGEVVEFGQPRCGIVDFFVKLALTQDNREEVRYLEILFIHMYTHKPFQGLSPDIVQWAEGASVCLVVLCASNLPIILIYLIDRQGSYALPVQRTQYDPTTSDHSTQSQRTPTPSMPAPAARSCIYAASQRSLTVAVLALRTGEGREVQDQSERLVSATPLSSLNPTLISLLLALLRSQT